MAEVVSANGRREDWSDRERQFGVGARRADGSGLRRGKAGVEGLEPS